MKKFKIAIVGATGAVGREMLRCVFQFNFPFESIKLLASARSAGKEIEFEGHKFVVEELTEIVLKVLKLLSGLLVEAFQKNI